MTEPMQPQTPAEVLDEFSPAAALGEKIFPFPCEGDLRSRLEAARYLMAPMAGVTDAAYRLMARRAGAGLAYTEMVSVAGIHYGGETGGQKTWDLVLPHDPEPDIAVQLFGSKPEQFREAASRSVTAENCHASMNMPDSRISMVGILKAAAYRPFTS